MTASPFNELWDFIPVVGDDAGKTVKLWIARQSRFIFRCFTGGGPGRRDLPDAGIFRRRSASDWRPDVSQNSRWVDPNGRLWLTSGWEEVWTSEVP